MRRAPYVTLASLACLAIFVGFNLAASRWLAPVRADFTASRLYTLSASAQKVLDRLVEPVQLAFVYSRRSGAGAPAIRSHAERVRQLMTEIAARSGGKVKITEIDPEPFSTEEDAVTAAGLTPAPAAGPDPVYLGVIGSNTVDDRITIPYLASERDALLEYELVRLISQLDNPAPPRIAVISSLLAYQADPGDPAGAFILREARRSFDVKIVPGDFRALPAGTDVLVMIHPGPLDPWQQYVIDQFLIHKGRALIALDPLSRASMVQAGRQAIARSDIGPLADMLGVYLEPDTVAERTLGLPVTADLGAGRSAVLSQPLFPAIPPALMSRRDVITADLSRPVNFGAPGRWRTRLASGQVFEPLIMTSSDAALIPADLAATDPGPRTVLGAYKPSGRAQVLAGRLSGPLRSRFQHPPDPPAQEESAAMARIEPFASRSEAPAEIILVADADMFDDRFYVDPATAQAISDNAAFVLNALDNLSGEAALTALRSRAPAARTMQRIDDMRAAARDRLFSEQQRLEGKLALAEGRIGQIEARRKAGAPLAASELAELAGARDEAAAARADLRSVERDFRRDIDALEARLELLNIWGPPLLAGLAGIMALVWRRRRQGGRP